MVSRKPEIGERAEDLLEAKAREGVHKGTDSVQQKVCPVVERAFTLLGKKWVGLILHTLSGGSLHFCELERLIPALSARILSQRMKELETEGLVERTVHGGTPVRVTYGLTEKGMDLIPVLASFAEWARRWEKEKKDKD
jgi:DNA-binding HxlR family transcriptional regulator